MDVEVTELEQKQKKTCKGKKTLSLLFCNKLILYYTKSLAPGVAPSVCLSVESFECSV